MKSNEKKKTVCCSLDIKMAEKLEELSRDSGVKKSELIRRAIRKSQEEGMNEALLYLCIVEATQIINEMDEEKDPENIKELKKLTSSMMKIKGGNGYGSI